MKYEQAEQIAQRVLAAILPHCDRAQIAGDVRRECNEVESIALVVIPRVEMLPFKVGLFQETEMRPVDHLYRWAMLEACDSGLAWIRPGQDGVAEREPEAAEPHWCAHSARENIKVDFYFATPKNWGEVLLMRTGSWEFAAAILAHARRIGRFDQADKCFARSGIPAKTPEEEDAFALLDLKYVPPHARWTRANLVAARSEDRVIAHAR